MKCLKHQATDAVAICAYCGRALCLECVESLDAPRLTCSQACHEGLAQSDRALHLIVEQNLRTAKASAFYCYLCAGLSAAAAVVAWFMLPSPFLILFTGGCALALFVAGFWYARSAPNRADWNQSIREAQPRSPGKIRGGGAFTNEVGLK